MELTILERFQCLNLLPDVGNIAKMRMRQKLIEKIGLSAEELEEYEVRPGEKEGTVQWRTDLPQGKEIDLKGLEIATIAESLKKLDDEEKLTPSHLTLYEKFLGE